MKYRKFIPKSFRPFLEQKLIYRISPKSYDVYMSLGENCVSATVLNQVNLRKFSGPFDWIAKEGFSTRVNQIESDFKDFLIYEDLRFNLERKSDNKRNTCLVENLRTGFVHPHDFHDDSYECYLEQKTKYQRRQERMYRLCNGAEVLFLYADFQSGLEYSEYHFNIDDYLTQLERLQAKLKTKSFSLILGIKSSSDSDVDLVHMYEKGSVKVFLQPVPCKYLNEGCNMYDWPGVFLKRAIHVATRYKKACYRD